jgi:CRP/FNR family cyclic AMP-dependent transcriptional regulator
MPTQRIEPSRFLASSGEGRTVATHKAGEVIFKQGEPAVFVYYLQGGRAKETVVSEKGKQVMVNMLEDGRFFGISGIFNAHQRSSTVTIISTAIITSFTQEAMRIALNQPSFARFFMSYLVEQNNQIEAEKADLLISSKPRRLAQTLVALAHIGAGEGESRTIGSEITQEMLAAMTGTTRSYVNALLTRFRERGLIKYNGGIHVLPALLVALRQSTLDPA